LICLHAENFDASSWIHVGSRALRFLRLNHSNNGIGCGHEALFSNLLQTIPSKSKQIQPTQAGRTSEGPVAALKELMRLRPVILPVISILLGKSIFCC